MDGHQEVMRISHTQLRRHPLAGCPVLGLPPVPTSMRRIRVSLIIIIMYYVLCIIMYHVLCIIMYHACPSSKVLHCDSVLEEGAAIEACR